MRVVRIEQRRKLLRRTLLIGAGIATSTMMGTTDRVVLAQSSVAIPEFDLGVCTLTREQFEKAVAFHGHFCPGLSIGIRASEWCLREYGSGIQGDVAVVVETDRCGTDAVQILTGCTFGKGNFIHCNNGKAVYNFYQKKDGRSARLRLNPELTADLEDEQKSLDKDDREGHDAIREKTLRRMYDTKLEEMFIISATHRSWEARASARQSEPCAICSEQVEIVHLHELNGQKVCGECLEAKDGK